MPRKFIDTFFRRAIVAAVLASIVCSSVPAQTTAESDFAPDYNHEMFRDEMYSQLFRRSRGADFENLLIRHVGIDNAPAVLDSFDRAHEALFRRLDTAYRAKAGQLLKERAKAKPATPSPARGATMKKVAFNPAEMPLLFEPNDDEIKITEVETEEGFEMGATTETTKTVNGIVITQGAAGKARATVVEGGNSGSEYKAVEYTEQNNVAGRTKTRTETTISWRTLVATCPDADGLSVGTATMTNAVKITITTPQTIAILDRNITTTMKVKGYVDDAAELTHYDMSGATVETISGYDRADRLGLIEDPELTDGTKSIEYRITNSKPGKPAVDASGFTRTLGRDLGRLSTTLAAGTTAEDARRVHKVAGIHIAALSDQSLEALQLARGRWRYGGCVEVKFTPAKTRLLPAEAIEVPAETVHKWEKSKINADLRLAAATASATPEKQRGEPQVVYNLTAPAKGQNAMIMVESVSRRGIALDDFNFEEAKAPIKKPPVRPKPASAKKCGAWSGKITAVKTKRTELARPASGRLVRQIGNAEETFSVDYHVLGIQDTSEGFTNAYLADAQMNYRAVEYRESNYAPGKMSCRGGGIITTPETRKIESLTTATPRGRITIYITSTGETGSLTFGSPEIEAERIITRTYESSCPSYDQVNSGVDRNDSLIGIPSPGFEISFELDAKSDMVLKGSKRIENSDGSTTVVTWDLSRDCQ